MHWIQKYHGARGETEQTWRADKEKQRKEEEDERRERAWEELTHRERERGNELYIKREDNWYKDESDIDSDIYESTEEDDGSDTDGDVYEFTETDSEYTNGDGEDHDEELEEAFISGLADDVAADD
ncbi:MAG: hypothetical protein AAF471_04050 [Myxococcota bacterium]